jgi:acyl-CoA thioesterase FadM
MANHVYVAYLAEARAQFMRAFDDSVALQPSVVAEVRCQYLSPLLARERFRVGVRVARIGRTSIGFEYEIRTPDRVVGRGEERGGPGRSGDAATARGSERAARAARWLVR